MLQKDNTLTGVKANKNPEHELFSGGGPGRGVGGQHVQSMQWLLQLKHLKGYYYYGIVNAVLIQTDFYF